MMAVGRRPCSTRNSVCSLQMTQVTGRPAIQHIWPKSTEQHPNNLVTEYGKASLRAHWLCCDFVDAGVRQARDVMRES